MKKILICINISLLVVIFTGILFMFLSKSPTAEDVFKKNQNSVVELKSQTEALLNAIVHNDWTISEPLVSFCSDRIEITSHGGIPREITKNDFFNGVSHPRNSVLMRIFLKLGIVEHTGHGIPKIIEKYGK